MDEELLTPKQAAEELGVARTTIYWMMDNQRIKYVVVKRTQRGRNRRIPRSEIERIRPFYQLREDEQSDLNDVR